jgi:hypothetical protein
VRGLVGVAGGRARTEDREQLNTNRDVGNRLTADVTRGVVVDKPVLRPLHAKGVSITISSFTSYSEPAAASLPGSAGELDSRVSSDARSNTRISYITTWAQLVREGLKAQRQAGQEWTQQCFQCPVACGPGARGVFS